LKTLQKRRGLFSVSFAMCRTCLPMRLNLLREKRNRFTDQSSSLQPFLVLTLSKIIAERQPPFIIYSLQNGRAICSPCRERLFNSTCIIKFKRYCRHRIFIEKDKSGSAFDPFRVVHLLCLQPAINMRRLWRRLVCALKKYFYYPQLIL
jgi:hypothetical protein